MKSILLAVVLLTTIIAEARDVRIIVKREPASAVELNGFTEALYGRKTRTCFSGAANQVCAQVKTSIHRTNRDLAQAGATQRFGVVTCAQNPNRTMVIFSLAPKAGPATKVTQKTVFIERCDGDLQPSNQQIAFSLSN